MDFAASEFNAFSDARIKNIKGISNQNKDLETLMKIEITDYTLRDTIAKGHKVYKKVIAQQIEKVYPQAVSKMTDVVPDIYTMAEVIKGKDKNNTIILNKHNLKVGERVKLIFGESQEIATVKTIDANSFTVTTNMPIGNVFVFGREVNDFHTVDYEALSTLNISATQALVKRLNNAEANIKAQGTLLEEQSARLNKLESMLLKTTADR